MDPTIRAALLGAAGQMLATAGWYLMQLSSSTPASEAGLKTILDSAMALIAQAESAPPPPPPPPPPPVPARR